MIAKCVEKISGLTRENCLWAGDMAQFVKGMPRKHEKLHLILRTHNFFFKKKLGMVVISVIPVLYRWIQVDPGV